jgi:hypothetical protein
LDVSLREHEGSDVEASTFESFGCGCQFFEELMTFKQTLLDVVERHAQVKW